MPVYKFEAFIFDSNNYTLTHLGIKLAVRPKALKLLKLLIENRHRILSKAEIMTSIWGSDYTRDYLLFQLIGELRKYPLKREFVRTQPNEGYQWNVTTKVIHASFFVPQTIAAGVAAIFLGATLLTLSDLPRPNIQPAQSSQLPAHSAFSLGIVALESGDKDKAIQWFEFALLENPDSAEASIFLAETLYLQNRYAESSEHLQSLLNKANVSEYNQASASNILSQISEQQGKFQDALKYAQKSSQAKVAGQCSANFVKQRVDILKNRLAMSSSVPKEAPAIAREDLAEANTYANQCNDLKHKPVNTSVCLPGQNDGNEYVITMGTPTFRIS